MIFNQTLLPLTYILSENPTIAKEENNRSKNRSTKTTYFPKSSFFEIFFSKAIALDQIVLIKQIKQQNYSQKMVKNA